MGGFVDDNWRESPTYERQRRKAEEIGIDITRTETVHDVVRLLMEHWAKDFVLEDHMDDFLERVACAKRRHDRRDRMEIYVPWLRPKPQKGAKQDDDTNQNP